MPRTLRAVALAAALSLPLVTPASASETHTGSAHGTGTISPGLTLTPTFQSVTFTADSVVLVGNDGSQIIATGCRFTGSSSIAETDLVGQGSGTLSGCTGASITGTILYQRQVNLVTASGTVLINNTDEHEADIQCQFAPTSANPVTSYALQCVVSLS